MADRWVDPDTGCSVSDSDRLWIVDDGGEIFVLPKPALPGTSRVKRAIANYLSSDETPARDLPKLRQVLEQKPPWEE